MDNKKKQELLTKDFVSILKKAEEICEKCGDEFRALNDQAPSLVLDGCIKRNRELRQLIIQAKVDLNIPFTSEKKAINFQNPQAIKNFQLGLDKILGNSSNEYEIKDVMSEHLSAYEKFEVELINALRGFFGRIEAIFTGQKFDSDQPNLGETRFALRATGHSQFLPRPMKSLNDAKEALDDISTRLNECVKLNHNEDDECDDDEEDSCTL